MLPRQTRNRILSHLPGSVDINVDGQTRRYSFEKWWAKEDHEIDYPMIVVSKKQSGSLRTQDQPFDDRLGSRPSDKPNVSQEVIRGQRLEDDVSIVCGAKGVSDGLSSADRADEMAQKVAWYLRNKLPDSKLAESGDRGEIPILVPTPSVVGPSDVSHLVDDSMVGRYEVTAQIKYTSATREEKTSANDYEASVQFD